MSGGKRYPSVSQWQATDKTSPAIDNASTAEESARSGSYDEAVDVRLAGHERRGSRLANLSASQAPRNSRRSATINRSKWNQGREMNRVRRELELERRASNGDATASGGATQKVRTIANGHRFRCVDSVRSEYKFGPDYDYAFQEQHSSKECLLPRAGVCEDYDDANRYLYQRRMVQRVRRNRPSKQHSYESCLNRKMLPGGTRNGGNVRVAPNGLEAQNWCHRRELVSPHHLKAETAADPILILQGAISPQTVPAYRIADNRRSRQRYEVAGYRPSGVIEDSSEDTSPPFERKQLRFTSLPCTAYHQKPKKSYRDIIKESKLKACYSTHRGAIITPPAISPRSPPSTSNIEDFNGHQLAYKADDDYVEVEERYDFENSRQRSGNCDHEKRTKCKTSSSKAVTRVHSGRTWPRKERVPAFPVRRVLAKERQVEPETWQITGDREMKLRLQTAYPTSLWDKHQGRVMADPRIPSNQKDRRFHGKAITEAEGRGGDESVTPLRPKFRPWKKSVTRPAVPLWEEVTPDDRETQFYSCRDVLTPELGIGADSEPQTETWSPLSLLPPMPQKRVHERYGLLLSWCSDRRRKKKVFHSICVYEYANGNYQKIVWQLLFYSQHIFKKQTEGQFVKCLARLPIFSFLPSSKLKHKGSSPFRVNFGAQDNPQWAQTRRLKGPNIESLNTAEFYCKIIPGNLIILFFLISIPIYLFIFFTIRKLT